MPLQYTQQGTFVGIIVGVNVGMIVGIFILGRKKGVLLGMGVKEGARVTDGMMNCVDDATGAAGMVCFCEAIDVLAMLVKIFICVEGVGVPFPWYLKKMIPRQQTEIATTIKPLTIYIMRLMRDLVAGGFLLDAPTVE